jgi:divinyl chlorophyllide a 8-vinyl-reductase
VPPKSANQPAANRVLLLGATGTIGRAVVASALRHGFDTACVVRPGASADTGWPDVRHADVTAPQSLAQDGFRGEHFDVIISCLASRNGQAADAWAIDYRAQLNALNVAKAHGATHFILLSAICVQRPMLPFQHAKLAFEKALVESRLTYSIIRPTAFFKSLSGQVDRVRRGKPFLLFGDGQLTACKPISDDDLADFLCGCIGNVARQNQILPIGGPGEAMTPLQQGQMLFDLLGKPAYFRHVPVGFLRSIRGILRFAGFLIPAAARKAELARIGLYYATESMLVWDEATGRYNAAATPSTGTETLREHYQSLLAGERSMERGEHSVF